MSSDCTRPGSFWPFEKSYKCAVIRNINQCNTRCGEILIDFTPKKTEKLRKPEWLVRRQWFGISSISTNSHVISEFGLALIQNFTGNNKEENVERAVSLVRRAVEKYHPRIVALPETFSTVYVAENFERDAEVIPDGPTSVALSAVARESGIYLIAGYIERDPLHPKIIYNTATVWGPDGALVAKHRKVHLWISDGIPACREAEICTPGKSITTFDIDDVKVGVAICYDSCFSEFNACYRMAGKPKSFSSGSPQLFIWNHFHYQASSWW